jgi:uncharacterized phage-associated protein
MGGKTDHPQPKRLGYSVRGLANWILDLGDKLGLPITNMALNKLLYFAIEKVLIERQALLTDARIEAWDHGPVFREVYHGFKASGDKPIKDRVHFYSVDTKTVEKSAVQLNSELASMLEEFLRPLLPLSAFRLRHLSHVEGGAWHRVWSHEGYANPGMEIGPETIIQAAKSRETVDGQH